MFLIHSTVPNSEFLMLNNRAQNLVYISSIQWERWSNQLVSGNNKNMGKFAINSFQWKLKLIYSFRITDLFIKKGKHILS